MSEELSIRLIDLEGCAEKRLQLTVTQDALDISKEELSFSPRGIEISGRAYLATDTLIVELDIRAYPLIPCKICNELFEFPIHLEKFYLVAEVSSIKNHEFRFAEKLRDAILLEVPQVGECSNGACPDREALQKYLRQSTDNPLEQ